MTPGIRADQLFGGVYFTIETVTAYNCATDENSTVTTSSRRTGPTNTLSCLHVIEKSPIVIHNLAPQ